MPPSQSKPQAKPPTRWMLMRSAASYAAQHPRQTFIYGKDRYVLGMALAPLFILATMSLILVAGSLSLAGLLFMCLSLLLNGILWGRAIERTRMVEELKELNVTISIPHALFGLLDSMNRRDRTN